MAQYKPEWLSLVEEAPIDPDLPIIDPHCHLYDDPVRRATMGGFMTEEFLKEIHDSGHKVVSTVHCEAYKTFVDADAPPELQAVAETRAAVQVGEESQQRDPAGPRLSEGIICAADLTLGDRLDDVLAAHREAAKGRLRGVRSWTMSDPDVALPYEAPVDLIADPAFVAGARRLVDHKLTWDAAVFHPQIPYVAELAEKLPDLPIILNHVGIPIYTGRFKDKLQETYQHWLAMMTDLARYPNVYVKVSGLLMGFSGRAFDDHPTPPTSQQAANAMEDHYIPTIDLFGPERCMFTSNFPRDRLGISYGVLWNAHRILASRYSAEERAALFHGTAAKVYNLQDPA
ncbi:amidohydrolase family protein [Sphingobium mellinum]|uniref:amidohydrolase family protein n=1 Tax=Sphingobium mellinum TaxID=1387166 RepID=UPI0030EF92A8